VKKYLKKIALVLFILFIIIQFYQPARNVDNGQVLPVAFTEVYNVPKNVENILRTSCYDCHSNNTNYRWYDLVQPSRLFVDHHIKKAKEELNFNEFGSYSQRKQKNKLDRISKQVKAGKMPLPSYLLMHSNAKLSDDDKQQIINWVETRLKQNE